MALLKLNQRKYLTVLLNTLQRRCFTKYVADTEIKKCYSILGISEDSDQESIRSAYLELVKKYHPDSGQTEANSEKFQEIDKAFKILLSKKSKERWSGDEVNFEVHAQVFDIKHTAPQHRQYLNYGGLGSGTPFQREKQYGKIRAMNATENVLNHRLNKLQADEKTLMEKKPQKHNIKTKYGYERIVEDLILQSMSNGEFDNLSGKGKPLKGLQNQNPYVDFVTHKMNQVLIDNGFTPEWIMLQKEIRLDKQMLIDTLLVNRGELGAYPFDYNEKFKWNKIIENCRTMADDINKKIKKYNLVVPVLQNQMMLLDYEKEAEKIAKDGQTKFNIEALTRPPKNEAQEDARNIFSFLESFFLHKSK